MCVCERERERGGQYLHSRSTSWVIRRWHRTPFLVQIQTNVQLPSFATPDQRGDSEQQTTHTHTHKLSLYHSPTSPDVTRSASAVVKGCPKSLPSLIPRPVFPSHTLRLDGAIFSRTSQPSICVRVWQQEFFVSSFLTRLANGCTLENCEARSCLGRDFLGLKIKGYFAKDSWYFCVCVCVSVCVCVM